MKIKKILKNDFLGIICYLGDNIINRLWRKRIFSKKYYFEDRQKKADNLLIIIAGFQPFYWEEVLERVKKCQQDFKEGIDICICVPEGIQGAKEKLLSMANTMEWSFLYITKDLLAQVQNTAIELHPNAKWIFKIDEDILLCQDYFTKLKNAFLNADRESYYPIGFMGPLLNINAACAPYFLSTVSAYSEFKQRFGDYRVEYMHKDDIVHRSPELAEFIWSKSIPFDKVALEISQKNRYKFILSPVRYSIGAILFERKYWNSIGCFKVGILGQMGLEEEQVCGFNCINFRPIAIALDVFAGHLGFYSQKETCRDFFEKNIDVIHLK